MYWLATQENQTKKKVVSRFSPLYWSINFPRPMMASTVTTGVDSLVVDLVFYRYEDLCGLIWDSVDSIDHPLYSYATSRDYSGTVLSFRWQSSNIRTLEVLNSPTLTIEGRDQNGTARTWYVRLWNYAVGTTQDAVITLDFDTLDGGFLLPAEADPVYPGDIDRMFISMVPPAFDGTTTGPLPAAIEAQVSVSSIVVTGPPLEVGGGNVQTHTLRIANGYDDVTTHSPERVILNMVQLGYQGWITHYVGMSHYFNLSWDGSGYIIDVAKPKLNKATISWHKNYLENASLNGFKVIFSLSYEILAQNIPASWQQKAYDGTPALTGWVPPSSLIAPTNQTALDYLRDVFLAFGQIVAQTGADHLYQIGEPWWWIDQGGTGVPHFYDDVTTALYTTETTKALPTKHMIATEIPTTDQQDYLDWLGDKLGLSTLWLRDQIKLQYPAAQVGLLFFSPQVLLDSAPMAASANFPTTHWKDPTFDFLQIEDYTFVINGEWAKRTAALAKINQSLTYPLSKTHYFAGFNLLAITPEVWANISMAIDFGFSDGFSEVFVWAYPQVIRDGVVYSAGTFKNLRNRAWTFSLDGHTFWVLFLGEQGTFIYDEVTGGWSKWQTEGLSSWNMEVGTTWRGRVIAGDKQNPILWELTPGKFIDDGTKPQTRKVTGGLAIRNRTFSANYAFRVTASLGEVEVPQTAPITLPEIRLRFSDDQGKTFFDAGTLEVIQGKYTQELQWLSLGMIRPPKRIFEITDTGAIVRLDGADADVEEEK